MRAGGFEVIGGLDLAHQAEVAWEDDEGQMRKCGPREFVKAVQAEQPQGEVQLVTAAVVDAGPVAKRVLEICLHLLYRGIVGEVEQVLVPGREMGLDGV